ncbi:hypothetical protein [Empedobacter brevis]|uniref:hypothetical protein n=1 Tax=Empedobacter brevis TaxID=247 RepID=UPI0028AB32E3|nr:hypothetical protein [Empedobacter brevis]
MTELFINGNKVDFDVNDNKDFEYSIQVHDLASVESVNASYTTNFKLPKTKKNVEIFKSLGLVGAISNIPYKKISARLVVDGVCLISDGWLRVNSTTKNAYEVNIENGILDFFSVIANKNIGEEIDLTELDHEKNIDSIISSFFEDKPYLYVLADYNGLIEIIRETQSYLNIDYLTPSVKISWLWNKIFEAFGYTFSGSFFDSEDFQRLFMTYPKSPVTKNEDQEEIDPVLIATVDQTTRKDYMTSSWDDLYIQVPLPVVIDPTSEATKIDDFYFTVAESGTYRFTNEDFIGWDEYNYEDPRDQTDPRRKDSQNLVLKLDSFYGQQSSSATIVARSLGSPNTGYFDIPLKAGEKIGFRYYLRDANEVNWGLDHIEIHSIKLKIEQISTNQISFSDELKRFSVTDFFKEILWRFGLTPFIDNETKSIHFLTLNERLNSSQVVDWSSKYIRRESEEYELGNYTQKNIFEHKYNDSNAKYNDGAISVLNENIEESKGLVTSKIYTYDDSFTEMSSIRINSGSSFYSITSTKYPIWVQEVKEENKDSETKIKVEYKDLNDRYYFLKAKKYDINSVAYLASPGSNIYTGTNTFYFVDSIDTTYRELIPKYYSQFEKIANNAIIHTISLALNPVDIANIDMKVLVYFKQESAYYLLNSLKYRPNGACEGEFIKIHK